MGAGCSRRRITSYMPCRGRYRARWSAAHIYDDDDGEAQMPTRPRLPLGEEDIFRERHFLDSLGTMR